MTRPVEDGRCSLFPDVFQLQWPRTANTSRITKWTLSLGGREGGAATLKRTLHEPWQHLFRFCMLRCFHQQCINQHMVVLWYVGRRWGVSTNFIWLQLELKPIWLLIEHIFSAYVIILLAGVLLFLYQPFRILSSQENWCEDWREGCALPGRESLWMRPGCLDCYYVTLREWWFNCVN